MVARRWRADKRPGQDVKRSARAVEMERSRGKYEIREMNDSTIARFAFKRSGENKDTQAQK